MGEIPGVCCICKKGCEIKRGKTAEVLPKSSLRRVGLLAGICWTKSQSPRYSMGVVGGGGDVVTNNWCISG